MTVVMWRGFGTPTSPKDWLPVLACFLVEKADLVVDEPPVVVVVVVVW